MSAPYENLDPGAGYFAPASTGIPADMTAPAAPWMSIGRMSVFRTETALDRLRVAVEALDEARSRCRTWSVPDPNDPQRYQRALDLLRHAEQNVIARAWGLIHETTKQSTTKWPGGEGLDPAEYRRELLELGASSAEADAAVRELERRRSA